MVPTSDFSGLASSICALASAVARAAIEALERCMARLRGREEVKADSARFGALGTHPMANCLFGVFRHQALEFSLRLVVLESSLPSAVEDRRKLRPAIGCGHVTDPHGLERRLARFDAEHLR